MALLAPARARVAPATAGYHKLVVPMLANPESKRAVEVACRLAAERHAEITIVTVIEVPPLLPLDAHMHDEEAEARRLHNLAIEIGDMFGVAVHPIAVRARDAATAILEEIERNRCRAGRDRRDSKDALEPADDRLRAHGATRAATSAVPRDARRRGSRFLARLPTRTRSQYRCGDEQRPAEALRARDALQRRGSGDRHGCDRALRALRPGAQPGRALHLRRPAGRGRVGPALRLARLGREHARLQLVLPAAAAHVHARRQRELVRARRLPRDRGGRQRARRAFPPARGRSGAARARVGSARRARRPSCSAGRKLEDEVGEIAGRAARVLGVESAEIELGPAGTETTARTSPTRSRSPDARSARSTCRPTPTPESTSGTGSSRRSPRCSRSPSEREQLESEALEAEMLRRSDLVKTALLRAVSHDLRSPLTGIRTAIGTLRPPDAQPERRRPRRPARDDRARVGTARAPRRRPARPLAAGGGRGVAGARGVGSRATSSGRRWTRSTGATRWRSPARRRSSRSTAARSSGRSPTWSRTR